MAGSLQFNKVPQPIDIDSFRQAVNAVHQLHMLVAGHAQIDDPAGNRFQLHSLEKDFPSALNR